MKYRIIFLFLYFFCLVRAQQVVPSAELSYPPNDISENDQVTTQPAVELLTDVAVPSTKSHGERPDIDHTPDEGITVQVEKTNVTAGNRLPAGKVKIYSPWPAKPMFPAPDGWKFVPAPKGVAPYRTEAKLGSGQMISLAITPFVLVPITDGQNSIRIREPGFQPELGYLQHETIGVMLQKSNVDLQRNEKQVADSIRRLQQLLISLPKNSASTVPKTPATSSATKP